MNRLLPGGSRRDKSSHGRNKSAEVNGEKEGSSSQMLVSSSFASISAAFPYPHGKSLPYLQRSETTVKASTANSGPHFLLQPHPHASNTAGIIQIFKPSEALSDKKTDKKVQKIKKMLRENHITEVGDPQIEWALQTKYANGDVDNASDILKLFQRSVEGKIEPLHRNIAMVGAENRRGVTCWLDSVLFCMYGQLQNFDWFLSTNRHFNEEPKQRLAALIRIWVNLLRTGKLIQIDLTKYLQEALRDCGWKDAARDHQQDASEAFGFITDQLGFPLLKLQVALFHQGEYDDDDLKIIGERLLEVAVPPPPENGARVLLEEILESFFNDRVDVMRSMDQQKRGTLQRMRSQSSTNSGLATVDEKLQRTRISRSILSNEKDEHESEGTVDHIEDTSPLAERAHNNPDLNVNIKNDRTPGEAGDSTANIRNYNSSGQDFPLVKAISESDDPGDPIDIPRPGSLGTEAEDSLETAVFDSPVLFSDSPTLSNLMRTRSRSESIVRRFTMSRQGGESSTKAETMSLRGSIRKGSIVRKEVLIPAFQFYKILRSFSPIYSDNLQSTFDRSKSRTVLIKNTAWSTNTNIIPEDDSQVAATFTEDRPILGICLKRYALQNGRMVRQNTAIDIPLQIDLPNFIQDQRSSENGLPSNNFVLKLQSMVCHRGSSLQSGHYIGVVREEAREPNIPVPRRQSTGGLDPPEYTADKWIMHDDIENPKIKYVDIQKVLEEEMPYLLFYQVQPLLPDPLNQDCGMQVQPPAYGDLSVDTVVQEPTPTKISPVSNQFSNLSTNNSGYFAPSDSLERKSTSVEEEQARPRVSFSDDGDRPASNNTGTRTSITLFDSSRRGSLAAADGGLMSQPVTPSEDVPSRLSRAANLFGKKIATKSRSTSHVDENRSSEGGIGSRMSRIGLSLTAKSSKERLMEKSKGNATPQIVTENNKTPDLAILDERLAGVGDTTGNESSHDFSLHGPKMDTEAPNFLGIGRNLSKRVKKDKGKGSDSTRNSGTFIGHQAVPHLEHIHNNTPSGKDKGKATAPEITGDLADKDRQCNIM